MDICFNLRRQEKKYQEKIRTANKSIEIGSTQPNTKLVSGTTSLRVNYFDYSSLGYSNIIFYSPTEFK